MGITERYGREMGGMTGGMKMAKALCIKGFAVSDGRDEGFFASLVKSEK